MSDDRDERPKLSFSELDKLRRGERVGRDEPRGHRAKQEQARARIEALTEAGSVFSMGKGGAEGKRLANEMRDTHGTSDFLHACRSYCEEIGFPQKWLRRRNLCRRCWRCA